MIQNNLAAEQSLRAAVARAVADARAKTPLAGSITNNVTIDFVANAQLAVGGSAAMVYLADEGEYLGPASGAFYINAGTQIPSLAESIPATAAACAASATPWVLDPVGIGIGAQRTQILREVARYKPAIVRANASEVIALAALWDLDAAPGEGEGEGAAPTAASGAAAGAAAGTAGAAAAPTAASGATAGAAAAGAAGTTEASTNTGAAAATAGAAAAPTAASGAAAGAAADAGPRGVDSMHEVDAAFQAARAIATFTGGAVAISGPTDLVVDATRAVRSFGGSDYSPKVTGFGCSLGGVCAVYAAVAAPFEAALAAVDIYNAAGTRAAAAAAGPASFKVAFIDALANLTPQEVADNPIEVLA